MKKIRLQLESLAVATFETAPPPAGRGTVAAHQPTFDLNCEITAGINSCWCSEIDSCICTWDCSTDC